MSRKKTVGEPVLFRLPLAEDAIFRDLAKARGISVHELAKAICIAFKET